MRKEPKMARFHVVIATLALALVAAAPVSAAEVYTYDTQSRLTDVSYQNGSSLHYTYDANGNILSIVTSLAAAVDADGAPLQFALGPTTPNPGGGARDVTFTLPSPGRVVLRVFDVTGRLQATLVDRDLERGHHDVRFSSERWGAGVYFYRLELAGKQRSGRMVVLR
jgi:YD repeat-containing protein